MPDDKTNVGEPDRSRIAADYEVSHHAETLSISSDEGPVGTTVTIGNGDTTHGGRRKRYPSAHGSGGYAFTHSEKTQLIERFGNDREKLYAAAETLKLG
jgi:hypothetical protein